MSFHGRYGDLSTLEAAKAALIDIDKEIPDEDLVVIEKPIFLNSPIDYDLMRLQRTIEGLQMVIWLNGGFDPSIRLPRLFDHKNYKGRYDKKMVRTI